MGTFAPQGVFTFLHASQIDKLYNTPFTSAQIKTNFDSQAAEMKATFNTLVTLLNAVVPSCALTDLSVDGQVIGEKLAAPMAASCAVYDLLYLSSTGYNKAKGDADSTIPCRGMCLETGTGTRSLLKRGYVKNNAWAWTTGQLLYVSAGTAGLITSTLPSSIGNRVQIVGYAESATVIFFNPDYTFVQV